MDWFHFTHANLIFLKKLMILFWLGVVRIGRTQILPANQVAIFLNQTYLKNQFTSQSYFFM